MPGAVHRAGGRGGQRDIVVGAELRHQEGEVPVDVCQDAVSDMLGTEAELSTEGGTSDGRFIRPTGAEVVELGPINRSIHKIDEHVSVQDLDRLAEVYHAIIGKLLD